jgi:UBX domain-containing protein 1/4
LTQLELTVRDQLDRNRATYCYLEGALRATQNRGLQPAMDHLIEHEGQSIPSDGGAATAKSSGPEVIDVDEDEDDEALRAALKLSKGVESEANNGEDSAVGEAKVTY